MAKTCLAENCNNPIGSHKYCWHHQYLRTDEKYIQSLEKKKHKNLSFEQIDKRIKFLYNPKLNPIKRTPLKKQYKASGEKILFNILIKTRPHISWLSGLVINNIDYSNCAHVLSKAQNKYPAYKLCDFNIVFLTRDEHRMYDQGTIEERQKYAYEMLQKGITVDWSRLYLYAEELKLKYKNL